MTEQLNNIKDEVTQILHNNLRQIDEKKQQLEEVRKQKQIARKEREESFLENDSERLLKATAKLEMAEKTEVFLNEEIAKLKNTPLISKADFKKYERDIKKEFSKEAVEIYEEALKYFAPDAAFPQLYEKAFSFFQQSNELLEFLQTKVYRDPKLNEAIAGGHAFRHLKSYINDHFCFGGMIYIIERAKAMLNSNIKEIKNANF